MSRRKSRFRAAGLAVAGVSLAVFAGSLVAMTSRARAYNEEAGFKTYNFFPHSDREIRYTGWPEIRFEDAVADDGSTFLRLTFGTKERLIPVKEPPAPNLPGLLAYDEWFKAMEVTELVRDEEGELRPVRPSRLLLVSRRPAAGHDPETWGLVRRAEWTFEILELFHDNSITSQVYRWPRSERSERGLLSRVERAGRELTPELISAAEDPDRLAAMSDRERVTLLELIVAQALIELPELDPRSLEFQVALHVIPKLQVPSYKFQDTAVKGMGWTLPAAAFSFLVFCFGMAFAVRPRAEREAHEAK